MGAFPVLLDLGARAVCSLENMCSFDLVYNFSYLFSNFKVDRKLCF